MSKSIPLNTLCRVKINKHVAENYKYPYFFQKTRTGYYGASPIFQEYPSYIKDELDEVFSSGNFRVFARCIDKIDYVAYPEYVGYSDGDCFHVLARLPLYTELEELISNKSIDAIREDSCLVDYLYSLYVKNAFYLAFGDDEDENGNKIDFVESAFNVANRALTHFNDVVNYLKSSKIPYVTYQENLQQHTMADISNYYHYPDCIVNHIVYEVAKIDVSKVNLTHKIDVRPNTVFAKSYGAGYIKLMNSVNGG